jgi:hypothetical protein
MIFIVHRNVLNMDEELVTAIVDPAIDRAESGSLGLGSPQTTSIADELTVILRISTVAPPLTTIPPAAMFAPVATMLSGDDVGVRTSRALA